MQTGTQKANAKKYEKKWGGNEENNARNFFGLDFGAKVSYVQDKKK